MATLRQLSPATTCQCPPGTTSAKVLSSDDCKDDCKEHWSGDYSATMVLAARCRAQLPATLGSAAAKVQVVARQPYACWCPWQARHRHILSFKFTPDGWQEVEEGEGSGMVNLSDYSFTNLTVLNTYGRAWPLEVQVKSRRGVTVLRRRLVLGDLRRQMTRQLHAAQDFHMLLSMDFTAEHFEAVIGGVVPREEEVQGRRPQKTVEKTTSANEEQLPLLP